MKQGTGKSTGGGQKVEPKSKAVNPEYAAHIGLQKVHTRSVPVHEGRGIEAPKAQSQIHHRGSQGRHS